jgi:type I restriction enzyme S subunit
MTDMALGDAFFLNPTVSIRKGTITPFVPMDAIKVFTRTVSSHDERPFSGGTKFLDGDVLMARITPSLENGKTSIYRAGPSKGKVAAGSTEFIVFRGRDGLTDSRFAYYLLTSDQVRTFAISQMNGSTGRQRVQTDALAGHLVRIPDLDEQLAIVELLGSLDDKIESNRGVMAKALELGTALLTGALVGGAVPATVDEVADFQNRRRVPLSQRERATRPGPYPYYGATGIFGSIDDYIFDEVLILIGEDGSVVQEDGSPFSQYVWGKCWINNHAHAIVGKGVSSELLYLLLKGADVRPLVTGAAQPKLNMGNLKSLRIELPTGHRLTTLESRLSDLFRVYRARADEARMLERLRDSLLPELLAGDRVIGGNVSIEGLA